MVCTHVKVLEILPPPGTFDDDDAGAMMQKSPSRCVREYVELD